MMTTCRPPRCSSCDNSLYTLTTACSSSLLGFRASLVSFCSTLADSALIVSNAADQNESSLS